MTTYPAQRIVGVITKKGNARGTFIFLCMLFEEIHVRFLEKIEDQYETAEKITLVMDNLNTHVPGSLYETFQPDKAKAILDRFEFVYTPKPWELVEYG